MSSQQALRLSSSKNGTRNDGDGRKEEEEEEEVIEGKRRSEGN
jgi:hypothetical protein